MSVSTKIVAFQGFEGDISDDWGYSASPAIYEHGDDFTYLDTYEECAKWKPITRAGHSAAASIPADDQYYRQVGSLWYHVQPPTVRRLSHTKLVMGFSHLITSDGLLFMTEDTPSDFFFCARGLNGTYGYGADWHTLTFAAKDVSGYSNLEVRFKYYIEGFDGVSWLNGAMFYEIQLDDGSTWLTDPLEAVELTETGSAWAEHVVKIPGPAHFIRMKIWFKPLISTIPSCGLDEVLIKGELAPEQINPDLPGESGRAGIIEPALGGGTQPISISPKFFIQDEGSTYTDPIEISGIWSDYGNLGHWKIKEKVGQIAFNNKDRGSKDLFLNQVLRDTDDVGVYAKYKLTQPRPTPTVEYYITMGFDRSATGDESSNFADWLTAEPFGVGTIKFQFDIWADFGAAPTAGESQTLFYLPIFAEEEVVDGGEMDVHVGMPEVGGTDVTFVDSTSHSLTNLLYHAGSYSLLIENTSLAVGDNMGIKIPKSLFAAGSGNLTISIWVYMQTGDACGLIKLVVDTPAGLVDLDYTTTKDAWVNLTGEVQYSSLASNGIMVYEYNSGAPGAANLWLDDLSILAEDLDSPLDGVEFKIEHLTYALNGSGQPNEVPYPPAAGGADDGLYLSLYVRHSTLGEALEPIRSKLAGTGIWSGGVGTTTGLHHVGFMVDVTGPTYKLYVDGKPYLKDAGSVGGSTTNWDDTPQSFSINGFIGCRFEVPIGILVADSTTPGIITFDDHFLGKIYQVQLNDLSTAVTDEMMRSLYARRFDVPRGPAWVDFSDRFEYDGKNLLQELGAVTQVIEKKTGQFFINLNTVKVVNE